MRKQLQSHPGLRATLRWVAVGVLLLSVALVVWSVWPTKTLRQTLDFSDKNLAQIGFTSAQQSALKEYHLAQITLEWPQDLRVGETGRITLSIEPQLAAGPITVSQTLAIDAQMDLAGLTFYPANEERTSLPAGQLLRLFWQVSAAQAGEYAGNAWLYIVFPDTTGASGSSGQGLPLSAQNLSIKVISLAGLDVTQVRILAALGIAAAVLLMLIVVIKS